MSPRVSEAIQVDCKTVKRVRDQRGNWVHIRGNPGDWFVRQGSGYDAISYCFVSNGVFQSELLPRMNPVCLDYEPGHVGRWFPGPSIRGRHRYRVELQQASDMEWVAIVRWANAIVGCAKESTKETAVRGARYAAIDRLRYGPW